MRLDFFSKINFLFAILLFFNKGFTQNLLFIPDTISGTLFNLTVQSGTKQFIAGNNTPTFGYNGNFLGPTLIMNKGDSVLINVKNNLNEPTTVHWHGFHIPAKDDGGPHQIINPSATWSPSFRIRNNAATYWYHPHGEGKTEIQISKGLAGIIIIRDSAEAIYNLPRTYGIDDFPLIVQSRVFDFFYQVQTATHEDSIPMVNGTIDAFLQVPKQVVRFRLLNASADRTYLFGLSDSSSFYVIASDGGLLTAPYLTNRIRLSTGERAEILVDFSNDIIGSQKYLMSYSSELSRGIIGADSVGTSTIVIQEGYYGNPLNGADFNLLKLEVIPQSANPVNSIPASFSPINLIPEANATVFRNIHFSPDTITSGEQGYVDGPFLMNDTPFHMDSINQIVYLNDTEIWTLTNQTMVAHPFHIHDIQFFVLDINGNSPPPEYSGFKDVILVKPDDTVRFITKFETFADNIVPYMFHCHLLHHEDDGMMGTFLVIDTTSLNINTININNELSIFPNPSSGEIFINNYKYFIFSVYNMEGKSVYSGYCKDSKSINLSELSDGLYIIRIISDDSKLYFSKISIMRR
jgi:blue copper oxidase